MADFTWPSEVIPPNFLLGTTVDPNLGIIRQDMDGGPAKVRRRFSSLLTTINAQLILTDQQLMALVAFLQQIDVVSAFDIEAPFWDITIACRFVQAPKWTLAAGGAPVNVADPESSPPAGQQRKWNVSFTLESV